MMLHEPDDSGNPRTPDPAIRDAANNALAVASLQLAQATAAFRHVLHCARSHGLTLTDCCRATGLDEAYLARMLDEVA